MASSLFNIIRRTSETGKYDDSFLESPLVLVIMDPDGKFAKQVSDKECQVGIDDAPEHSILSIHLAVLEQSPKLAASVRYESRRGKEAIIISYHKPDVIRAMFSFEYRNLLNPIELAANIEQDCKFLVRLFLLANENILSRLQLAAIRKLQDLMHWHVQENRSDKDLLCILAKVLLMVGDEPLPVHDLPITRLLLAQAGFIMAQLDWKDWPEEINACFKVGGAVSLGLARASQEAYDNPRMCTIRMEDPDEPDEIQEYSD